MPEVFNRAFPQLAGSQNSLKMMDSGSRTAGMTDGED
jgi:hypothetical protein